MSVARKPMNILGEDDHDDPILSVVNLIDVFLVIIAVLLIVVVENPLNPFATADEVVVVKNPGKPEMEMIVKQGEELTHYRNSGQIGEGKGIRAGITYRLEDGALIYVPEDSQKGD
jgi:hypothetical protein